MKALSKSKISLYLAGLFLAGAVTGAFASFAIGRHMMMKAMSQEKMAAHWRGELQSKLSLSPEQVQAITPILDEAITGFKTVFAEQMLASLSNANARIAVQLTAEQKTKFAELEKQQQEFIRKRFQEGTENPQEKP
jgi:hypothetical protein